MHELKFALSSMPGALAGEGEGRLLNAFAVKEGDSIYFRRVPGLAAAFTTGGLTPRGMYRDAAGNFYVAYSGSVTRNTAALTGTVSGTDGVTFAENNNGQIVAVREGGGAYTVTSTTVAAYPDADLPSDVNSVTFGNAYFFFSRPNGQIWASGQNTTDIDPLSFATAESRNDGLLRVVWHGGVLYAFGTETIEPWLDEGLSPFPLQRGSSVIPCGLLTTMAVAGDTRGWDRSLYFVAHDRTVRALTGYTTKIVSTPPVERFLRLSTASTVTACVYTSQGNAVVVIASDQGCWEYNTTTGFWNQRQSASMTGWRAQYSVLGTDGYWRFGDRSSTSVLVLSAAYYDEVGTALTFEIESTPFKGFPAKVVAGALFLDFTQAVANALISWSWDGGAAWQGPATRALDNANKWPVRVNGLGLSTQHGLRVKITVATAADFSFRGGSVTGPQLRVPRPDVKPPKPRVRLEEA